MDNCFENGTAGLLAVVKLHPFQVYLVPDKIDNDVIMICSEITFTIVFSYELYTVPFKINFKDFYFSIITMSGTSPKTILMRSIAIVK